MSHAEKSAEKTLALSEEMPPREIVKIKASLIFDTSVVPVFSRFAAEP